MAVAAGQVQPLDHAGLDAGWVFPAAELERLKAVVDDHLAGPHRRRELGPDAEITHVVVGAHLVALADAAGGGVVHVHEHERAALVRLLHDAVDDVGGVNAPAVVAAGEDEGVVAAHLGVLLVHGQLLAGLQEPLVVDVELGAAGERRVGELLLRVPAERVVRLVRLDG